MFNSLKADEANSRNAGRQDGILNVFQTTGIFFFKSDSVLVPVSIGGKLNV